MERFFLAQEFVDRLELKAIGQVRWLQSALTEVDKELKREMGEVELKEKELRVLEGKNKSSYKLKEELEHVVEEISELLDEIVMVQYELDFVDNQTREMTDTQIPQGKSVKNVFLGKRESIF